LKKSDREIDRSPFPTAATYRSALAYIWDVVDKGGDLFGTAINVRPACSKGHKAFLGSSLSICSMVLCLIGLMHL
jgi:hypothetical protein